MASTPRSGSVNEIQQQQSKQPTASTTVACVLAVDGGERLGKDWPHLAVSYVTAILRWVACLLAMSL